MLKYPLDRWESKFAEINGARLHYKQAGSGPPVILLHGYPETWYTWRHALPALEPHFTVYAPDFRGWGDSEAEGRYSLGTMVDDLRGLMQAWGHDSYAVVGHDWGAAAAFALARSEPVRFSRLITINMPVKRFDWTKPLHFYFFNMLLLPELVMYVASDAFVRFILRWWAHNQAAFPPEVVEVYQQAARRPGANAATRAYYRNTFRAALFRTKGSYGLGARQQSAPQVPWRVLWGDRDSVSPLRNLELLKEDVGGVVDSRIIEGAGHFVQEEQAEAFNREMLAFLLEQR